MGTQVPGHVEARYEAVCVGKGRVAGLADLELSKDVYVVAVL